MEAKEIEEGESSKEEPEEELKPAELEGDFRLALIICPIFF